MLELEEKKLKINELVKNNLDLHMEKDHLELKLLYHKTQEKELSKELQLTVLNYQKQLDDYKSEILKHEEGRNKFMLRQKSVESDEGNDGANNELKSFWIDDDFGTENYALSPLLTDKIRVD